MYSIKMMSGSIPYRCRQCHATTYRREVHRGSDGAMGYSGLYRCSGCDLTFSDPADWRHASGHGDQTQVPVANGSRAARTS